jgi:hypothetical protein
MNKKEIEKILKKTDSEEQKKRLLILYNGYVAAQKAYMTSATSRRLRDMEAAEEALNTAVELINKESATFPNILAVVGYLKNAGYRLEKSAAYKHNKEGKLRPRKDGKYYETDVLKYAALFLKRLDGTSDDDQSRFALDKARAEMDKTRAQTAYVEFKTKILEGKYVARGDFEHALAQRAAMLKSDMESFFRGHAPKIITLVGGKSGKTPDLVQYLLDAGALWLARYAEDKEFAVPRITTAAALAAQEENEED